MADEWMYGSVAECSVTLCLPQTVNGMACDWSRTSSTTRGCLTTYSAVETVGRSRYKLPRPGSPGSPGPTCLCFCLSRWYHYLPIVEINPFRPIPSHSATESQSFRFSVKMVSQSTLAEGGAEIALSDSVHLRHGHLVTLIQHFQDQSQYCLHVEGISTKVLLPFARRKMPGLRLSIKVRCQELVFRDQKTASNAAEYSDFSKASICLPSVVLKDMVSNRIRNVPGSNPQYCHTKVRIRTSTTDKATVDEHSGDHFHFCQKSSKCVEVLSRLSYDSMVLHDDSYKLKHKWSSILFLLSPLLASPPPPRLFVLIRYFSSSSFFSTSSLFFSSS